MGVIMANITILKNQVYGRTECEILTADIYLPENYQSRAGGIPVVVLMHGGAFKFGNAGMYTEWGTFLAENGMCAASINYRMSTPRYSGYPGVVDDVNTAVEYLISHAGEWNLDPYKMAMMGDSAGAYLAFMYTYKHDYASHKVLCIVGAYGVYDMISWEAYNTRKWGENANVVTSLMGCHADENLKLYQEASPMYRLEKDVAELPMVKPKVLLIWGELDDFVPCKEQSVPFAEILKKCRVKTETIVYKDCAHLWFPRDPINHEICSLDKYPLTDLAPKVLSFLNGVFSKQEYVSVDGELTCIQRSKKLYEAFSARQE